MTNEDWRKDWLIAPNKPIMFAQFKHLPTGWCFDYSWSHFGQYARENGWKTWQPACVNLEVAEPEPLTKKIIRQCEKLYKEASQ